MISTRINQVYRTLSKSTFPQELMDLPARAAMGTRFLGMNHQFIRAGIIMKLLNTLPFDAFLETGTFQGSTTLLVASQTKVPVLSCEVDEAFLRTARRRLFLFGSRIKLFQSDSREFLKTVLGDRSLKCPFIYLDSHWQEDLPLRGELAIIRELAGDCVVMIDDFRVPADPGFGWDTYRGVNLEWTYIKTEFEGFPMPLSVLYPSYPSSIETGGRRGWVLLACGKMAKRVPDVVPPSLLRAMPDVL
jgi:predicted O-methyltransferase YrrM